MIATKRRRHQSRKVKLKSGRSIRRVKFKETIFYWVMQLEDNFTELIEISL